MRTPRALRLAAGIVAVALVFLAGILIGGHPEATGLTELSPPLRGFLLGNSGQALPGQVLDALERDYFRDVDVAELEQASVEEMIRRLDDPYTTYLDPEALKRLRERTSGQYFGVGLQVAQRARQIVVTRVFEGSPAEAAGIRADDRLVSVDGARVTGAGLDQAVAAIRGPEGTEVRLGLVRPGSPPTRHEYSVERARITVPAVDASIRRAAGERIGYLRLSQFTRGAGDALAGAVARQLEQGVEGLVLDLRGNPGGLVSEAVDVAGVFLAPDEVVVITEGRHSPREQLTTSGDPVAPALPLAVLVDGGSASASEIVAGALLDQDRATLVGEPTFGKGLVQSTIALRDGGALKLTTARYVTPDGRQITTRQGLQPSERVVDDPDTPADEALRTALRVAAAG